MSNDTTHYFGAYLEIKVSLIEQYEYFHSCPNGHRESKHSVFCRQCGGEVGIQKGIKSEYPTRIYELIEFDNEDDENVLVEITPRRMYGTGIIVARANVRKGGLWLWVDDHDDGIDTKQFPTDAEVAAMKQELDENHQDVIALLKESPHVISVEIKAGMCSMRSI